MAKFYRLSSLKLKSFCKHVFRFNVDAKAQAKISLNRELVATMGV